MASRICGAYPVLERGNEDATAFQVSSSVIQLDDLHRASKTLAGVSIAITGMPDWTAERTRKPISNAVASQGVSECRERPILHAGSHLSQGISASFASAAFGHRPEAATGRPARGQMTWTGPDLENAREWLCQRFRCQSVSALRFAPGARVQALASKLNKKYKTNYITVPGDNVEVTHRRIPYP